MSEQEERLKEQVKLSTMAHQVVNNEAFKMAFIARRADLFNAFCDSDKEEVDVREEAWRTMQNLDALEAYFHTAITTGKIASTELDTLTKFNSTGIN